MNQTIPPGVHIKVQRRGYEHHGVHLGGGTVIHFSGVDVRRKGDASIRLTTVERFAADAPIEIVSYAFSLPADVVGRRALSLLGRSGYSLFSNNCEHFAVWAKTGRHTSPQVERAMATVRTGVGSSGGALLGTSLVASVGTAAGVSGGAGTMVGLSALGGAPVAVPLLGALPAAAAVASIHRAYPDDAMQTDQERAARRGARRASAAGAAITSGAAVATISTLGVTGLSAAGVTSGLATIGASVGGGMVAGLAMSIAAPAVAAVVVGHLVYRLLKRRPS